MVKQVDIYMTSYWLKMKLHTTLLATYMYKALIVARYLKLDNGMHRML